MHCRSIADLQHAAALLNMAAHMSRLERRLLLKQVEAIADDQYGVVSRQQIRAVGLSRWDVRNQVDAGRWSHVGRRTVAVHRGELSQRAGWWRALIEVGPSAALDGVTALEAAGMTGFDAPVCVSLPHGCLPRSRPDDVAIKVTSWRHDGDVVGAGIPRVRPGLAAVRGALWAKSNRQAAFILILAVQQRIATGVALSSDLATIRRHSRRMFVAKVLLDIVDGVRAMGELDFAAQCRRRGLPGPTRQVVRQGRNGRVYLDAYWDEWDLVVEIEGIHHNLGMNPIEDALRQNDLTLASEGVLRIPVLGIRLAPDAFMNQIAAWLRHHTA